MKTEERTTEKRWWVEFLKFDRTVKIHFRSKKLHEQLFMQIIRIVNSPDC